MCASNLFIFLISTGPVIKQEKKESSSEDSSDEEEETKPPQKAQKLDIVKGITSFFLIFEILDWNFGNIL